MSQLCRTDCLTVAGCSEMPFHLDQAEAASSDQFKGLVEQLGCLIDAGRCDKVVGEGEESIWQTVDAECASDVRQLV